MNGFKAKRVSGADLAAQLATVTADLPSSVPAPPQRPHRPPPTVQINFKATEAFADLVAREGEKAGSTRRFLARILRDAGYNVPEADLNPPDNRRRRI